MKSKARKERRKHLHCKIHTGSCLCKCEFCHPEVLPESERQIKNCQESYSNYVMLKMAGELND